MKKKQDEKSKRRTQVKELPKQKKELSKDEQKNVKGSTGPFDLSVFDFNKK